MSSFKFSAWPTEYRAINQYFGENRYFNYRAINPKLHGHEGIDIQAPAGSRIFSVASGTVTEIGRNSSHPYGLNIRITHWDGYVTVYAHLSQIGVSLNQTIEAGQEIARSGNTGNSRGAHLHLTLKKIGSQFRDSSGLWPYGIINPEPFLLPLLGLQEPAGPFVTGWVWVGAVTRKNNLAQANSILSMRAGPSHIAQRNGLVQSGTIMIVDGAEAGENPAFMYIPVQIPEAAVMWDDDAPTPTPTTTPSPTITPTPTIPNPDDLLAERIAGWAFSSALTIEDTVALPGPAGINLRAEPHRGARLIGRVPVGSEMQVTGNPEGEYTPVTVAETNLFSESRAAHSTILPDQFVIGEVKIGLRTNILEASLLEHARGNLIWVESTDIEANLLAIAHNTPDASWVFSAENNPHLSNLSERLNPIHPVSIYCDEVSTNQAKTTGVQTLIPLPSDSAEWGPLENADGYVHTIDLPETEQALYSVDKQVQRAIAQTKIAPLWLVAQGHGDSAETQAFAFLKLWGMLQSHPAVQGVLLVLDDGISAENAHNIADMIGWR